MFTKDETEAQTSFIFHRLPNLDDFFSKIFQIEHQLKVVSIHASILYNDRFHPFVGSNHQTASIQQHGIEKFIEAKESKKFVRFNGKRTEN